MQASGNSDTAPPGSHLPVTVVHSVKIVVVGGFGVGKTTLVGSVSEIEPLRTEEPMTAASVDVDSLIGIESKRDTTVAMDFGRITLTPQMVLFLFGIPGQQRFWDAWDGLAEGAIGAIVLVDLRRIADSFAALDRLDGADLPYVVAVNHFPDTPAHPEGEIRQALGLSPEVPLQHCNALDRASSAAALVALVEHAIAHPDDAEVPA